MNISQKYLELKSSLPKDVNLVVVTKTHPIEKLFEVYNAGGKTFGENKVQDLVHKHTEMPKDIKWHFIGHLQRNKVKYIAPFVTLIHAVDSIKLLNEIDKQAKKHNRIISCLLQVHIAEEEGKFGFSYSELGNIFASDELQSLNNIRIEGLMGMATNTNNIDTITKEFKQLSTFFKECQKYSAKNVAINTLSMGMSSDYQLAIECGSNMIRVGSSIFGARNYAK